MFNRQRPHLGRWCHDGMWGIFRSRASRRMKLSMRPQPSNWWASVGMVWRPLMHCWFSYRQSSDQCILFYQARVKRILYVWYDSVRHLFSRRPDDGSLCNERTAWLKNMRSGMITHHGTDLISSMPDFLQMVWVDTKKQLKLTTTSVLMTNKKGGGHSGAIEEHWCVTCSADPRLHYKSVLNSYP